eukprot:545824_1
MMWCFSTLLVLVSFIVFISLRKLLDVVYRKLYKYPPGSVGFPFIGLFFRGLSYPPDYNRIAKIYQPFTMFYVGSTKMIHVHDIEIMKRILKQKPFYENRHSMSEFGWCKVDPFSMESGLTWFHRRKHIQSSLLTILNYNYLDQLMVKALTDFIFPKLNKMKSDDVWFPKNNMFFLSFQSIYIAVFGKQLGENSCELQSVDESIQKLLGYFGLNMFLSMLIPKCILKTVGHKLQLIDQNHASNIENIIKMWITTNKSNTSFGSTVLSDLISVNTKCDELSADLAALFVVGTHSTSVMLEMILLYAAKYPDIQNEVYNELKSNGFSSKNLNKLHIFRAFIHECLRWSPIVGSSLPRLIKDDHLKIGKYNIPKNSVLVCNYRAVHFNEKYWKYPREFNIHHFLDHNEQFKKSSYFITFGYGRRDCMGKTLAMRAVYIVIAHLLTYFQFSIPQSIPPKSFKIPQNMGSELKKEIGISVTRR